MKSKSINFFWGLVMIGAGIVFFLREFGVIDFKVLSGTVWAIVFGVFSFFFLLTYFLKGTEQWGWLFPALIFGSTALTIGISGTAVGDSLSGALILLSIGVPFIVAFAQDPQNKRWPLIPAWMMLVLASVVFMEGTIHPNLIGTLVLYGIALPFLVVYLMDRTRQWALIPFGVLAVVGLIPLMELIITGQIFDMLVLGLLGAPFYVAYFWSRKNWWALIPAGVFTSVVLTLAVEKVTTHLSGFDNGPMMGGVMLAGLGLTFGILWLRRREQPTEWAMYPSLIFFALAFMTVLFGEMTKLAAPVILITLGTAVVVYSLIHKSK